MRLAEISTRFPPAPGGVERHVAEIAPRLYARGHAVHVLTSDLYTEFPLQRLPSEIPRHEERPFGSVDRLPVWSLPGELHYPFFRGLERTLERQRPDLVHVHTFGTHQVAVARRLHRRGGAPFVLTAHFHPIWSIQGGWLRHRLRRFYDRALAGPVTSAAARLIVQTRAEESLLRQLGIPVPPVVVIPPGRSPLPPPPGSPDAFRRHLGFDGPFFLFVGRLASNKGLPELVDAFERVGRADPALRLVLVGEDGGMGPWLTQRISEQGLGARVRWTGYLADESLLAAAMGEAEALVLPSEYEAFGLVLLEALAQGTPVIASRVGGIPEFIESERSGLLVPPGDVAALAAAMERIRAEPARARQWGRYGREEVVPRYTWEACADRLDALFKEVAGR
ncbi:MAG: glycosyltransferase family 4 protein [Thermoplasmata archaeon]